MRVASASEAFSAAAISGAEVRFDACFDLEATRRRNIFAVHSARLEPYGEDARCVQVLYLSTQSELVVDGKEI